MEENNAASKGAKRKRNEIFNQTFLETRAGALSLTNQIPFPVKLYQMLDDLEETENSHIASWSSDGSCIRVHDQAAFVTSVLGSYFRQTKYKSFQKQLYLYGFSRISDGRNRGYYFHPDFQRSNKARCGEIMPTKRKGRTAPDELSFGMARTDDSIERSEASFTDDKPQKQDSPSSEISSKAHQETSSLKQDRNRGSNTATTSPSFVLQSEGQLRLAPQVRLALNETLLQTLGSRQHPSELASINAFRTGSSRSTLPELSHWYNSSGNSSAVAPLMLEPNPFLVAPMELNVSEAHLHALQRQHQMNASLLEAIARQREQPTTQIPGQISVASPDASAANTPFGVSADNSSSMMPIPGPGLIGPMSFAAAASSTFRFAMPSTHTSGIIPLQTALDSGVQGTNSAMQLSFLNPIASSSGTSIVQSEQTSESGLKQALARSTTSTAAQNKDASQEQDSSKNQAMLLGVATTQFLTTDPAPSSSSDELRVGGMLSQHCGSSGDESIDSTLFES